MNFLVDWRQVTSVPTRETVTEIVHYYATHKEQFGHCRVASVTNNDAAYGMNRVASVFAEETTVTVQVFRHMDQAYRWARWGEEGMHDDGAQPRRQAVSPSRLVRVHPHPRPTPHPNRPRGHGTVDRLDRVVVDPDVHQRIGVGIDAPL